MKTESRLDVSCLSLTRILEPDMNSCAILKRAAGAGEEEGDGVRVLALHEKDVAQESQRELQAFM